MRPGFLEKLGDELPGEEVIEWMDGLSYDELIEIDLAHDRCLNLYHVEGKYHVPSLDTSYREMFAYTTLHMIHPDDRETYDAHMAPDVMLDRVVANAESPGCAYFQARYKLQSGGWRWVGVYLFAGAAYGVCEGAVRCYLFDVQNQVERERFGMLDDHSARGGDHDGCGGEHGTRTGARNARATTHDDYFEQGRHETRDETTRLVGEKAFYREVRALLARPDAADWCVIAIDIEHFRLFNDWYGRDRGDLLLAKIGEDLAAAEQATGGVAAYFGKDDFFVVVPFDQQRITRLHKSLTRHFTELNTAIGFRPMFGVCRVEPGTPILDLMDRANSALELARLNVKMGICLYESKMQERTSREYEILLAFKQGIRNREFQAFLQPQCRISSGKIIGAEALARWCKPDGTVVSPADFIPVLEKYNFITDLDCYIWEEVCALQRRWLDEGREVVPISVNVSQADFYAVDVPEVLDGLTSKYNIPKSLVKVEVTESTFVESMKFVAATTQRLRDMGFVVLMDDFGSGYSSLNMLSSLNVDVIKLDAGFFRMESDDVRKGVRIVESIVSMAKSLALPIITEGVETREQVEFLEGLGCRFIQGFYYYRPMAVGDFEDLVGKGLQVDDRGFSCKTNEQIGVREFFDASLYSDSMLNSILGAVAFCARHGDQFDIVRYNEQFYEEVRPTDIEAVSRSVQERVIASDRGKFVELFDTAERDLLNGASGIVGFMRPNGDIFHLGIRLFYLGDKGQGRLFYASLKDETEHMNSLTKRHLLAKHYPYSIVFLRPHEDVWRFMVAVNGLGEAVGFTQEQFQRELDELSLVERLKPGVFVDLCALAARAVMEHSDFAFDFDVRLDNGRWSPVHLQADCIDDEHSGITHILTISAR